MHVGLCKTHVSDCMLKPAEFYEVQHAIRFSKFSVFNTHNASGLLHVETVANIGISTCTLHWAYAHVETGTALGIFNTHPALGLLHVEAGTC